MVKEGVIAADGRINPVRDEETGRVRLVGDLDFDSVAEKAEGAHACTGASARSPTWLLRSTAEAAALQSLGAIRPSSRRPAGRRTRPAPDLHRPAACLPSPRAAPCSSGRRGARGRCRRPGAPSTRAREGRQPAVARRGRRAEKDATSPSYSTTETSPPVYQGPMKIGWASRMTTTTTMQTSEVRSSAGVSQRTAVCWPAETRSVSHEPSFIPPSGPGSVEGPTRALEKPGPGVGLAGAGRPRRVVAPPGCSASCSRHPVDCGPGP